MKKTVSTCIFGSLIFALNAQSLIWQESFETDGLGVNYSVNYTFNDGLHDHFGRTDGSDISIIDGSYSGEDGSYFWAMEDTDNSCDSLGCANYGETDGESYKRIQFATINTQGYNSIQFKGLFAAGSNANNPAYDRPDGVVVSYALNNDTIFTQALKFRFTLEDTLGTSNERIGLLDEISQECPLQNPNGGFGSTVACENEVPNLGANIVAFLDSSFQEFSFDIPGSPDSVKIKLEASFNSANEEFAFDNFRLEGDEVTSIKGGKNTFTNLVRVYPNPAKEKINIFLGGITEKQIQITLSDLSGNIILEDDFYVTKSDLISTIVTDDLESGIYILKVKTDSDSQEFKISKM